MSAWGEAHGDRVAADRVAPVVGGRRVAGAPGRGEAPVIWTATGKDDTLTRDEWAQAGDTPPRRDEVPHSPLSPFPPREFAVTTASIVITSHCGARFIGQAISSALAQTADGVEVVVIDDGSTDESRRIIEGYGHAIRAVFQEHRGQAAAMLAGFRASTGDVILFLDGDDLLYPDAIARMRSRFRHGVAKVQARLDLIDERSRPLGRQTPPMPMPSGDLTPLVLRHGWYPAPPTSGNAFTRAAVDGLLPVPESYAGLRTADGRLTVSDRYLSVLGALRGEVVSVPEPLGAHRLHAGRRAVQNEALLAEVRRRIERTAALDHLVRSSARARRLSVSADIGLGTPNRVKERLLSLVLDPAGHPVPSDTCRMLVRAGVAAAWRVPWSPLRMRIAQSAGLLALALLPGAAVAPMLGVVIDDWRRPRWLSSLLGMEV